jgi:signal transduction histidine kinase/CheY-like chemotaxis protein/HPt (histidine-containing phosphotransfer) domain-containing protein
MKTICKSIYLSAFESCNIAMAIMDNTSQVYNANDTFFELLHSFRNEQIFLNNFLDKQESRDLIKNVAQLKINDTFTFQLNINTPHYPKFSQLGITRITEEWILVTLEDISNRITELQAHSEAQIAAEQSAQLKNLFFANMSHEIRTPIGGVIGMIEMLSQTRLNQRQRTLLSMADSAAKSLLGIVNDILDFSKIEANKMNLNNNFFNLRDFIEEICSPFAFEATQKGIKLEHIVKPSVPARVCLDSLRVRQILNNLISNSVKFTDEGKVAVVIGTVHDADTCYLSIKVMDSGVGIPEELKPHLFQSYSQLQHTLKQGIKGTGLGLAITKKLVELMEGSIEVTDNFGMGSVFTAKIPLTQMDEPIDINDLSQSVGKFADITVLVAEDNPLNQKFISHQFKKLGVKYRMVGDGKKCLEKLKSHKFDLVFMDVQMPHMNGIEATEIIRSGRMYKIDKNIPIIALTAYSIEGEKDKLKQHGMTDYLAKPANYNELSEMIDKYCKTKVSMTEDEVNLIDSSKLEAIFCDSLEDLYALYDIYHRQANEHCILLEKALEEADAEKLQFVVHSIKGSSTTLNIPSITQLAHEIEKQLYNSANPEEVINQCQELEKLVKKAAHEAGLKMTNGI